MAYQPQQQAPPPPKLADRKAPSLMRKPHAAAELKSTLTSMGYDQKIIDQALKLQKRNSKLNKSPAYDLSLELLLEIICRLQESDAAADVTSKLDSYGYDKKIINRALVLHRKRYGSNYAVPRLVEIIHRIQAKDAAKIAAKIKSQSPFCAHFASAAEAQSLSVDDTVDFRFENGRFILCRVIAKTQLPQPRIEVHPVTQPLSMTRHNRHCMLRTEFVRLAVPKSISLRCSELSEKFGVDDCVDVNPEGSGWRHGRIVKVDAKSAQVKVSFYCDAQEQDLAEAYWVHLDNADEVAPFKSKTQASPAPSSTEHPSKQQLVSMHLDSIMQLDDEDEDEDEEKKDELAVPRSISRRRSALSGKLQVGDFVDVNPKGLGWRRGCIEQVMSRKTEDTMSEMIKVSFDRDDAQEQLKSGVCWVDLLSDEVAPVNTMTHAQQRDEDEEKKIELQDNSCAMHENKNDDEPIQNPNYEHSSENSTEDSFEVNEKGRRLHEEEDKDETPTEKDATLPGKGKCQTFDHNGKPMVLLNGKPMVLRESEDG